MPLLADQRTRLVKLLGMTGSAHDGEALTALRYAQRLMRDENVTWEDTMNGGGVAARQEDLQKARTAGFQEGYAKGWREGQNAPRAIPRTWRGALEEMLGRSEDLTEWEEKFLTSFQHRKRFNLSPRQRAVFERIAEKLDVDLPDDEPAAEPPF